MTMQHINNADGARIVADLIGAIQANKQRLSAIDGAIGDGDHGINMSKGFSLCGEELQKNPGDLTYSLKVLSKTLMSAIGGAMGPLYGMFFRGLANGCEGKQTIDAAAFGDMLSCAESAVKGISQAKVGDKTLMDALLPAVQAYSAALQAGKSFPECLTIMQNAAEEGRDATKELVAKVGRASRLGERSKGSLDAGATSCALILKTMAGSIRELLRVESC